MASQQAIVLAHDHCSRGGAARHGGSANLRGEGATRSLGCGQQRPYEVRGWNEVHQVNKRWYSSTVRRTKRQHHSVTLRSTCATKKSKLSGLHANSGPAELDKTLESLICPYNSPGEGVTLPSAVGAGEVPAMIVDVIHRNRRCTKPSEERQRQNQDCQHHVGYK